MKHYLQAARSGLLAFWHAFRGHPLTNARDEHKGALQAVCRAAAEVNYHGDLAHHFDSEARRLDPHQDWHYFASLKDSWLEHVQLMEKEQHHLQAANARLTAAGERLQTLLRTYAPS